MPETANVPVNTITSVIGEVFCSVIRIKEMLGVPQQEESVKGAPTPMYKNSLMEKRDVLLSVQSSLNEIESILVNL